MRHSFFTGLGIRLLIMVLIAAISVLDLFSSIDNDQSLKPVSNPINQKDHRSVPVFQSFRRSDVSGPLTVSVPCVSTAGFVISVLAVSFPMIHPDGYGPVMASVGSGNIATLVDISGGVLAGLGILALGLIVLAWILGRRSRQRDLQALIQAARGMADGDLANQPPGLRGELSELKSTLNHLAEVMGEKLAAVQRDREKFQELVERIPPVSYYSKINDGTTDLYISPQIEALLGYSPDEIIQVPRLWAEAIHPDDRDRVMSDLTHVESGVPWLIEFRMIKRDGKTIWCRDQGIAIRDGDGESAYLYGTLSDITEITDLIGTLNNERDIFDRVIDTSQVGIVMVSTDGKIVNKNHHAETLLGLQPEESPNISHLRDLLDIRDEQGNPIPADQMPFSRVLKTRKPVYGDQINLKLADQDRRIISVNATPYLDQAGNIKGVIVTLEDISELQRQRIQMEALVSITAALRNAVNRNEMFAITLSQVIDLLKVDGSAIVSIDPTNNDLVFQLGLGIWSPLTDLRIPAGRGITAQVVSSGKPYLHNDIQNDPNLIQIPGFMTPELIAGACVPLQTQSHIIGAIWIGRKTFILDADLNLLSAISDIAANAIHRATLFEQTQERLKRLSALHTIDLAITSSLDIRVTMSILLDQIMNQMGVHAANILLLNQETQTLEHAAGRGFASSQGMRRQIHLGEPFAGQVALTRRPILIPDIIQNTGQVFPMENEAFMAYFAEPLLAKGQIKGVIELFHRARFDPDQEWIDFFHAVATQAAIAIDNLELFNRLQRTNDELTLAYDATIEGWARALELRDRETKGHSDRVTDLTLMIAQRMGVKGVELSDYRRGVLLHDIGKMAVPDEILLKPGPLTPEEWEIIRMHPRYAFELLYPVPYLRRAVDIPYCHHERWDGRGYPRGLKGESIPFSARIFSVVDVWDTLRSARPYREAWSEEQTHLYIRSKAGVQFDPRIVESFFEIINHRNN